MKKILTIAAMALLASSAIASANDKKVEQGVKGNAARNEAASEKGTTTSPPSSTVGKANGSAQPSGSANNPTSQSLNSGGGK